MLSGFYLSPSQFLATQGQVEPPLPSSDTLALPPRIQPQVGGTGFDPLPKKREMEKKPPFLEVSLLLWPKGGLGKWPTLPLSLQKKRKRRVYRLPRSGVLDLEPPLPRLRGEHSSQVDSVGLVRGRERFPSVKFPSLCRDWDPWPPLQLFVGFHQCQPRRLLLRISRVHGRDSSGPDTPGQCCAGRPRSQGPRVWAGAAGTFAGRVREPEQRRARVTRRRRRWPALVRTRGGRDV